MDEWRLAMRRWLSLVIVSTRVGGVPALLQPKHGVRQPMKLPTILLDCVTELGRLRCGLASMEVGIDGGGGEKCL
jgi:hypothetical protein